MKKTILVYVSLLIFSVFLPSNALAFNDINPRPFIDSAGNVYTVETITPNAATDIFVDYLFKKYDSNFNHISGGDRTVRMENWIRFGSFVEPMGFSSNGLFWFSYYPNTGSISNLRLMSININNPIFTQLADLDIRDDHENYTYGPMPRDGGINATIIGDYAYVSYHKTRISSHNTNYLLKKVNLINLTSSNLSNYDSNRGYSYALDVDSVGNIYVIRNSGLGIYSNSKTIEKLDSSGNLLYTIAHFPPGTSYYDYSYSDDIDQFGIKVTPDGRKLYIPYKGNTPAASTTLAQLSIDNASPAIKYANYYMNNARTVFYGMYDGVPKKLDVENRASCYADPTDAIVGSTTVKWQFFVDSRYGFLPYKFYWSDTANVVNQDYASRYYGVSTQKIYSSVGTKNMSVAVEDINGNFSPWKACPNTVTVTSSTPSTPLSLSSCTPSATSATTGNTVTWNATATGGTAPYRYYFSDVSGVVTDNTTGSVSRTYTTTGSKSMSIAVGDATNAKTAWAFCTGNVNVTSSTVTPVVSSPTITPWTGPTSVTAGSNLSYSINFNAVKTTADQTIFVHFVDSTGTNRFVSSVTPSVRTTQWTGTVSTPITVSVPANTPAGTYKVMAGLYTTASGRLPLTAGSGVTADNQTRYQVGTITVTTPTTPLTLSCTPSVTSATTGTTVTWNATARGGVTPYRYYFSDVANQISDNTTGSISRTYTTAGQKYMSIAIIDSANTKIDWAFCTGNVNVTATTVVPPVVTPTIVNITVNRWSGPTSVVAGNSFSYNLNWGGAPTAENETIFVHFIDSTGNMKFYNIVNPATPTKQWSGSISTPITVSVPANTPAGTYRVMVGMYVPSTTNGASGPRLPMTVGLGVIADNQTRYQVGTITVSASATGGTGSVWNAISKLFGF
jgi:hypothetical protein